jgi:tRNA-2-methylthio-N6-dimethylallyladenosine synthase
MVNDVPLAEKKDRLHRLITLQEQITREINAAEAGRLHEVLVEGPARKGNGMMGRTRTDKTVVFPGDESLVGQLVNVRITEGLAHTLLGEIVAPEAAMVGAG